MPEAIPPRQATELSTKEDVLGRATPMGGQYRVVQDLFAYARDTRREGRALSEDALVQERLLDAFIDCEIGRLFEERNERMKLAGQELTYETAQYTLWTKESALRVAGFIHDVVGPFALLGGEDPCAPPWRRLRCVLATGGPGVRPGRDNSRGGFRGDGPWPGICLGRKSRRGVAERR